LLPSKVFDQYAPTPLGNDIFAQFGDHFSLPIFGNFDPPVAATSSVPQTNVDNSLDVNHDGSVSSIDALLIINQLNSGSQKAQAVALGVAPSLDVNGDKNVSSIDALLVINYLNNQAFGAASGEAGEGESDQAAGDATSADLVDDDLLGLLASDLVTSKQRTRTTFG
jgi:hypothetical protein